MQLLSDASTADIRPQKCAKQMIETIPLVMQFMRRQMRKASSRKLSIAQLRTLNFVSKHDLPSLSCAAEFIGLSLPAMSRLVDGLVKADLLTRRACADDRRHVRLAVTPVGQSALDESWKSTHVRLADEVAAMKPQDCRTISAAMDILRQSFDPEAVKG
ncbi:MAG TPA: MarR family transcriptional regulator [Tepidisphaeraceae bacterium]|jgi:MarR family transcriptional regulator for hemolysin|nr:MarR family transcriptional regulator [Tepidisphaeraceae bacterium]